MNREYHTWYSPHLRREMELLVFGHAGARTLVFPTRAGRFFDCENWGIVEAVRDKIEQGWLQLFCVDSVDAESFYCNWCPPRDRLRRHQEYESYLIDEVLPLTRRTNPDMHLTVFGCSFGAFHAVNLAFRHPQQIGKVVACSGRYDLTQAVNDFRDLLDGHYDDSVYFNTPCHFVPNIRDGAILGHLRRMEIALAVGETDPFLASNQRLSQALCEIQVPHALHVWHGRAHSPRAWRRMAQEWL